MNTAANGLEPLRELLDELGEAIEVGQSPLLELGAPLVEVEALEGFLALGAQPGHCVDQGALQVRIVERLVDPAGKVPPAFRQWR